MGRIIFTVIVVVVLAVLVSMNLGFTTTVNLFGKSFTSVSVVAVAALSFVAGILYFLFIYIGMVQHRSKKRGLDRRDRHLSEREKELDARQAEQARAHDASGSVPGPARAGRSGMARFLDFFKMRQ